MFVYLIVCNESLKLYVGQHKGNNLQKYLQTKLSNARRNSGTRAHLFAAMRKHPKETWSIHPLVSGIESKAELDELEKHFIRVLKTQHPDVGYNICDGGEGYTGPGYWLGKKRPGFKVPKRPGWRNTSTFENGNKPWNAGKAGCSGQISFRRGKKMQYKSDETKQSSVQNLRSDNWTGKHFSAAHKANLSAAHKAKPWSAARRLAQVLDYSFLS